MNKNKKIAMAVVSTVMAGTMAVAFAACGDPALELAEKPEKWTVNKADGSLDYSVYSGRKNVTLNIGIGHNNNLTSTTFKSLGGAMTLPDGVTYEDGKLKPAWEQMGKDLNITWNDVWGASGDYQASKNIKSMLSNSTYNTTDMFTTDLSEAVSAAASGTKILNLGDYLEYMPNFANFLNDNPVVYLSLLQEGMKVDGADAGSGKNIYVAPYFDGNDDIERYCIMRQDWAEKILKGSPSLTKTVAWSGSTSVTSFMGKTDKITVDNLTADGNTKTKLVKNYDDVIKSGSSFLTTYNTTVGKDYSTDKGGNIVDIMNQAIADKPTITGAELATLYRAYIDVCYQNADGTPFYTADTRQNVFNGYDACWDVDDLVAMLRIVKTSGTELVAAGTSAVGIAPRDGTNDRTPDLVRLAAQLYGVRGADSRYENTYIDNTGKLHDARNDVAFYQALENLNKLKQEGLVADYSALGNFKCGAGKGTVTITSDDKESTSNIETFMMYDYSQTQTLNGFDNTAESTYNFSAVLTPVSKWDVNGNGDIDEGEIFRFTESWRSTKTGGLALNGLLAYKGYEDKLIAALQFVDYLYSEDGQIVSTYGPMATKGSDNKLTGGFWYNEEAAASDTDVFTYKGVKYKGTEYKGRYTPTITQDTYDFFVGKEVNKTTLDGKKDTVGAAKRSFTSFARMLIGSTLPVGVKDQSFENQLTSEMGQKGANKVGKALSMGVVKGMTLKMDSDNYWFVCVPTGLPVASAAVRNVLNNSSQDKLRDITGRQTGNKNWYNIFNHVILNGMSGTYDQQKQTVDFANITNATQLRDHIQSLGSSTREKVLQDGWDTAKTYWNYLKTLND